MNQAAGAGILYGALRVVAVCGAGVAAGLVAYAIGTWGRAPSLAARVQKHERYVRFEEPLLPQMWRFLRVLAGGRTVTSAFGSFYKASKIEGILEEAMFPWGLRSPNDVYAIGLPLGLGIGLALAYLSGMWIMLLTLPMFLGIGISIPVSALKLVAKGTRQAQIQEMWLLLSGLEIYLGAKYTLYDALREASGACNILREPIEKCLLEWGSLGAADALDNLGRAIRLPEAYIVITALRQAADMDASQLQSFMVMAAYQIDKTMEAHQARSRQIKPMLQSSAMVIPMFNIIALWTMPLAYGIQVRLNGVWM